MILDEMIRKLTDAYNKNPDSNIGKLILIIAEQYDKLHDTLTKIENWRDVNQAEGKSLDLIGKNVDQLRGVAIDEVYRVMIKSKYARNNSKGTINSMIEALTRTVNADPSEIKIRALYEDTLNYEPAALSIDRLPLEALNRVGLTINQFTEIAKRVSPAGVSVSNINLEGTFSLSSQSNVLETNRDTGLAPIDQSTGGTLGTIYEPSDNESTLPI